MQGLRRRDRLISSSVECRFARVAALCAPWLHPGYVAAILRSSERQTPGFPPKLGCRGFEPRRPCFPDACASSSQPVGAPARRAAGSVRAGLPSGRARRSRLGPAPVRGQFERLGLPLAPVDKPSRDEWMPLIGGFAELDMDSAHRVMIGEFFAGLDVRAELPALGALVEGWPSRGASVAGRRRRLANATGSSGYCAAGTGEWRWMRRCSV
jgi:hypothetical protein